MRRNRSWRRHQRDRIRHLRLKRMLNLWDYMPEQSNAYMYTMALKSGKWNPFVCGSAMCRDPERSERRGAFPLDSEWD